MRFAGRVSSAIQRAANKARGRSFAELRERGEQFMVAALERRGLSGPHGEPTDAAFWGEVDPALAAEVGRDFDRLHARFLEQTSPRFFSGAEHAAATAKYLNDNAADLVAKVVHAANRVRNGGFDLLGYEALRFGAPVDWHLDPTTGIRSPRSHWSVIRYLDPSVVGDHKVVWELNRHQHFMLLGRAYRLTGNEEYAQTFVDHVTAWMSDNPPKQGINWASSLEVSYRLIAWVWAIELFRDSPKLTARLRGRMLKYLHAHATHVERFLSTYFSPNTHLTGEALGPGTLYATLARLEARGLIEAMPAEDRRRPYRLTADGAAVLRTQLEGIEGIVRAGLARIGRSASRSTGSPPTTS